MDVVGVILVGGRGERARPITVKARGYLRSKAAMSFCGKRLIVWLLEGMRRQGVREFFVIAQGKENRYQTKTLVGHGDDLDAELHCLPGKEPRVAATRGERHQAEPARVAAHDVGRLRADRTSRAEQDNVPLPAERPGGHDPIVADRPARTWPPSRTRGPLTGHSLDP